MAAYEMACSLSSLDWDIHVLTRPLDSPDESFRSHQYSPLTTLPDTCEHTLEKDINRRSSVIIEFCVLLLPHIPVQHILQEFFPYLPMLVSTFVQHHLFVRNVLRPQSQQTAYYQNAPLYK